MAGLCHFYVMLMVTTLGQTITVVEQYLSAT
jgi:hypothetical protein